MENNPEDASQTQTHAYTHMSTYTHTKVILHTHMHTQTCHKKRIRRNIKGSRWDDVKDHCCHNTSLNSFLVPYEQSRGYESFISFYNCSFLNRPIRRVSEEKTAQFFVSEIFKFSSILIT